jgi:hypothetical protein
MDEDIAGRIHQLVDEEHEVVDPADAAVRPEVVVEGYQQ